jgi:hypothetical protein
MEITKNNVIEELYGHIFMVDKTLWIVTDVVKISKIKNGICNCIVSVVKMCYDNVKCELDLQLKVTNDAEYDDKLYFKMLSVAQGKVYTRNEVGQWM